MSYGRYQRVMGYRLGIVQQAMLDRISEFPGVSVAELGRWLRVSSQRALGCVRRLEELGMVEPTMTVRGRGWLVRAAGYGQSWSRPA
jgi:DNA-binding MarR family transcriptional regulator